jgi:hypothetical protein
MATFTDVHDSHDHTGIPGVGGGSGSSLPNLFVGTMPSWMPTSASAFGTANRVVVIKFLVNADITVGTVHFALGASSGNLDIGIYDTSLNRLGSTGSFAAPGTGQRSRALSGSVALSGGTAYYAACAADNGTLKFAGYNGGSGAQVASGGYNLIGRKESTFPLPDPLSGMTWEDIVSAPALFFVT